MVTKTCKYCTHYLPEAVKDSGVGKCTLQPIWITVGSAHYCGQFNDEDDERGNYFTPEIG